jgi:hypothetical protein
MSRPRFYVWPPWPPKLAYYDYLCEASNLDWAWEFLRRNPRYQCQYKIYQIFSERPVRHVTGIRLTRTRRRCHPAEAWELCSFRRSGSHGKVRSDHVATDSDWTDAHSQRRQSSRL